MTPWQITDQNVSFYFLKDLVTGGSHNKDRKRAFDKCQLVLLTFFCFFNQTPTDQALGRAAAAAAAKSLQLCPTPCDPIDGSPWGSPVPGILQARTLEWVAISSSNAWKWKVKVKSLSLVRLLATPWTADLQAPLSMGFSRQECRAHLYKLFHFIFTATL